MTTILGGMSWLACLSASGKRGYTHTTLETIQMKGTIQRANKLAHQSLAAFLAHPYLTTSCSASPGPRPIALSAASRLGVGVSSAQRWGRGRSSVLIPICPILARRSRCEVHKLFLISVVRAITTRSRRMGAAVFSTRHCGLVFDPNLTSRRGEPQPWGFSLQVIQKQVRDGDGDARWWSISRIAFEKAGADRVPDRRRVST